MFLLKKIIAQSLAPTSVCLEVMIAGVILLLFTRRQRTGKYVITLGIGVFALLSYPAVSKMLVRPLEHRYQPLFLSITPDTTNDTAALAAQWIVVLGGGHVTDPKIPVTSQLTSASLARTIEAIRLHRRIPGSKLIVSGGKGFDIHAVAETMANTAHALGVRLEDIVLESESQDTADEAQLIKPIVGNDAFILVTSAIHMPRSMALFEKLGMRPIPAPADYAAPGRQALSPDDFFPSPYRLSDSHSALHEYLGIVWSWLRRQI